MVVAEYSKGSFIEADNSTTGIVEDLLNLGR